MDGVNYINIIILKEVDGFYIKEIVDGYLTKPLKTPPVLLRDLERH